MMTRSLMLIGIAAIAISPAPNHAPTVKIINPADKAVFPAASSVRYEISAADTEDGDSRYDEIDPKQVMLELTASEKPSPGSDPLESPGLALMARSNCFNCHGFDGRLIGPSLREIAKNKTAADTLIRRILLGSSGIWGREKMPSHPELNAGEIRQMVQWIRKYAAAPGLVFQNGLTGILQFPSAKPGAYTITASYTDHGTPETPNQHLSGRDRITVIIK